MHRLFKVRHLNQFEVWTSIGPVQHCDTTTFLYSVIDLLLCLGSSSCYPGLHLYALAYRVVHGLSDCWCPINIPPPPCLTVAMRCSCWYAVWFPPNEVLCMAKPFVCPKDTVPEILRFDYMQHCKPRQCCHVLFRKKIFFAFFFFQFLWVFTATYPVGTKCLE